MTKFFSLSKGCWYQTSSPSHNCSKAAITQKTGSQRNQLLPFHLPAPCNHFPARTCIFHASPFPSGRHYHFWNSRGLRLIGSYFETFAQLLNFLGISQIRKCQLSRRKWEAEGRRKPGQDQLRSSQEHSCHNPREGKKWSILGFSTSVEWQS